MKIEKINWNGLEAVLLETNIYEAIVIPSVGANLIKLFNKEKGVNVLRTPSANEVDVFKGRPHVFGVPVLFPPNRIEDGTYTYAGKKYTFPITMPAHNHYHHGILKSQEFTVCSVQENAGNIAIELVFFSNIVNNRVYENFPHDFICTIKYALSDKGLEQTISFENLGVGPMPLGIGFHTTLAYPFTADGLKEDYKLYMSVDKRWEQSERGLPTGKIMELRGEEVLLKDDGFCPLGKALEWHLVDKAIQVDGKAFHGTIFTDTKKNLSVFYEVDDQFKHWTLWTNDGEVDWICPEPQTFADNAPNLKLPEEVTGMQAIAGGKTWSGTSWLYVK
jgi:aldose 1-epimerase